jgi:hypothetical protein
VCRSLSPLQRFQLTPQEGRCDSKCLWAVTPSVVLTEVCLPTAEFTATAAGCWADRVPGQVLSPSQRKKEAGAQNRPIFFPCWNTQLVRLAAWW